MPMSRKIVIDIETTGQSAADGHRIVEVTAVEMNGNTATGREFHVVLNPERDIPADVVKIHGITNEAVAEKPFFAQIAQELKTFVGDAPIVIACAGDGQDINFLNAEMEKAGFAPFKAEQWVNIHQWSNEIFGAGKMTTEKLMSYYKIDRTRRADDKCKSAFDARLLSKLYPRILNDYKKLQDRRSQSIAVPKPKPPFA